MSAINIIKDKEFSIRDFQLEVFKDNLFIPLNHSNLELPDLSGNYIICLNDGCELPYIGYDIKYSFFQSKKVIYTGIGKNLRNRDYKQHFTGNNAGSSTLRKSIGVLLGYERIHRDKGGHTSKSKFNVNDEIHLSDWMKKNLVMYYFVGDNFNEIENFIIKKLNPPLNLRQNHNSINFQFRARLSTLRNSAILKNNYSQPQAKEQLNSYKTQISLKTILKTIATIYIIFRLLGLVISS